MDNHMFESNTNEEKLTTIKKEEIDDTECKTEDFMDHPEFIKICDNSTERRRKVEVKTEYSTVTTSTEYMNDPVVKTECDEDTMSGSDEAEHFETTSRPDKKRPKKKHISKDMKEVILNIFEKEFKENRGIIVNDIVLKVALKVGVGRTSVFKIVREYRRNGILSEPKTRQNRASTVKKLDDADKYAIRRKVHEFFFRNEVPTIEKVLKEVNGDDLLPNFKRATFHKVLKSLNFKWQDLGRYKLMMDREEIIMWRRDYLTKIKAYRRENRPIYYLDETWVDETLTSTRLKNPAGKEKRLIVSHIGNEKGFVDGDLWYFKSKKAGEYHEEMNAQSFEKWFEDILPHLEANSVIVLDNAPCHSRRFEKMPKSGSKKGDVQNWLRSKDIHFDDSMLKSQLLALVKQYKANYQKYIVDEMAESQNKTVLRLPPYHCELNPIQLIWADVKNFIAQRNTSFKFADVIKLFNEALQNITAETWRKCVQHVIENVEVKMWELDNIIETQVDSLLTNPAEDDDTDDDEESDSS